MALSTTSSASQTAISFFPSSFLPHVRTYTKPCRISRGRRLGTAKRSVEASAGKPTKLVTFLGKGGSGKTTTAVLAAKYFAKEGLRTCLVLHSQDLTAEYLLGCKIGHVPSDYGENFSAVRLETTKMILEPLVRLKKADARVNLTQGVLDGIVGEELGILLGMDSGFSALEIEKYVNFLERRSSKQEYDVVVYDGTSTDETLRMIASAERARWYLRYVRNLAEKTDIGRLSAPSILKLAYESIQQNSRPTDGRTSTEIWDDIQLTLERASSSWTNPSRFRCYLVLDPCRDATVRSALRYWGCAIQAGIEVSGALGFVSGGSASLAEGAVKKISPMTFALVPHLAFEAPIDWTSVLNAFSSEAKSLLSTSSCRNQASVQFDKSTKAVTLFMPGFDKSEIKLYQYRGGAELLVEAGDQRRIISLPAGMQGKVAGAKFSDSNLIVTLR